MVKMEYTILLWLFGLYSTSEVQATTHWMVTETGLIKPRVDSPFEMARPYDLLAFLNQDTRWDNIRKLYNELSQRQVSINQLWKELVQETDINKHIGMDKNCVKAGPLTALDWYATHMEDGLSKHIAQEEYQLYSPSLGEDMLKPNCKKISSLTFSMYCFEHLESVMKSWNLTIAPEKHLPELISPLMTVDQFGHWVTTRLKMNTTSWLHYNLASLYWRAKGNAPKAVECSRRAVLYAPRRYKDIALLNFGTILHRAKKPSDAVIVLGAAVDHDPQSAISNFILANAYTVYGDFNSSLKFYDQTLKLNTGYEPAEKNRYGVLCKRDLIKKMRFLHRKLSKLKAELTEYAAREGLWLKTQAAFLRTMKHKEEFDYTNVVKIVQKMAQITGLKIKEIKKEGDKNALIQYFLDGPLYNEQWLSESGIHIIDAAFSLQRLVKHIGKHSEMASTFIIQPDMVKVSDGQIKREIGPLPAMPELGRGNPLLFAKVKTDETKSESQTSDKPKTDDETYEFEMGLPLYPPTMKISRNIEDFDRDADWPSDEACKTAFGLPYADNVQVVYPVFLPFENKGLRLKGILTDRIGVSVHSQHELPWHPPLCPAGKEAAATQKKAQKQQILLEVGPTDFIRQKLLEYVGDGYSEQVEGMDEAEIGQRITSAMQSNVAPKWLVYTLASLYWRVRSNNQNALSCLLSASRNVRTKYKDVVLTSLASVYLEMGFFDEALQAAEEAFKISLYEPATNFILAELNMIKKHRNTQMFHLKQVVRVEAGFMRGLARTLLVGWGCLLKQVNALQGFDFAEGDVCTQVEPGVSMVCDKSSTNCHVANIHCFTHSEKDSTSTYLRLMEALRTDPDQIDELDIALLDPFIMNMPLERSDKEGHSENMERMVDIISSLQGCGPKGCSRVVRAEDLNLKEDDCTFQYLQLGYWLHIISFRQLIAENDVRLPPEVNAMVPTGKKVPECRIYGDASQDFFLDRLLQVNVEGWEPGISIMHQFAEMFDFQDYITLGAKFAKYIETKPRSWTGALGAGWWCGAGGRGPCALRCLAAAYCLAPPHSRAHALRSLASLLHMQSKQQDAKEIAYLAFYMSPKNKIDAFLVAMSNSYMEEYESAVWMYRYALTFEQKFLPATACLHATMCMLFFGDKSKAHETHDEM